MKMIAALLIFAVIISGCVQQQETIKIGGLFGLTGFSAEWGEADRNGALLAIEEANAKGGVDGKQIDFIVEDTKSDFTQTTTALRKLASVDGVKIIIGPTWGEFSEVAVPVAEEQGVVLISPSAGAELETFKSKHFFSTWPSQRFELQALTDFMSRNNYTKTAIIFTQNVWSQNMKDIFMQETEKRGINVVEVFETQPNERDYRTIITRLKQLDIRSVFTPFASESDKGVFLKQANELGLNKQFFATVSTESSELLNNFAEYAEGIIYTFPEKSPSEDDFLEKYEKRFGKKPQAPNAATAYDAANAVILALQKEPKNTDELISNLLKTDFDGVSNHMVFDRFGSIAEKNFVIKTFTNGTFVRKEA